MMDFFKVRTVCHDPTSFIDKYKPTEYANTKTGEIKYPYIVKDGPMDVSLNRASNGTYYIMLKGSIHKYCNYLLDGVEPFYNYNDFSQLQVKETVDRILAKYPFAKDGTLQNLEFGFNLSVSFNPKEIIEKHILHKKGKIHNTQKAYRNSGMFKEFEHDRYWIKIYDKGKHFKLDRYILRVELKFRKNAAIKDHGIKGLQDICNLTTIKSLYKYLLHQLNGLCIVDQIDPLETFTVKELGTWNIQTSYQRVLAQKKGPYKVSGQTVIERRNSFNKLLRRYNLDKFRKEIFDKLESKYNELTQLEVFTVLKVDNTNTVPTGQNDDNLKFSPKYIGCNVQVPMFLTKTTKPNKREYNSIQTLRKKDLNLSIDLVQPTIIKLYPVDKRDSKTIFNAKPNHECRIRTLISVQL